MKNKKTYAELERKEMYTILKITILVIIIIGFYLILAMRIDNLNSQLQLCQENVEVWTLETECSYPNESIPIYIYAQYNFTNYTEYLEVKEEIDKLDICVAIE